VEVFVADVRTLLAQNMKYFRKILGISQMVLAERVGCSTTMIGNIEIKKAFPSPENFDRIAEALEVQTGDLLADNQEKPLPLSVLKTQLQKEIKEKLEVRILAVLSECLE
jgi:transcriptional regulator with XRE-family HTH domain